MTMVDEPFRDRRGSEDEARGQGPAVLRASQPLAIVVRGFVYLLAILGSLATILWIAKIDDTEQQAAFRDGGLCEMLQLVLVGLTTATFAYGAWQRPVHRRVYGVWGFVSGAIFTRELDAVLDDLLPLVGWQLPAGLCLGGAAAMIVRDPAGYWSLVAGWLTTHGVGMLWAAMAIILIFAQLIGQADLWKGVLGDAYERAFKRVIEESSEFFGYTVLLLAAAECVISPPRDKRANHE